MRSLIFTILLAFNANVFAGETLELGLYTPADGGACAYEVVKQTNDGVVIIFRNNPKNETPVINCPVGVDYPIGATIVDSKTFVDVRTGREFNYYGPARNEAAALKLGLYLPADGGTCAYQVVKQSKDSIVIIFRNNPTSNRPATCAVGMDYPIKAKVLNEKSFIDVRTDRVFKFHSEF